MTAFAAVLSLHYSAESERHIAAVADALGRSTGAAPGRLTGRDCTLLLSPLHSWDPPGPIRQPHSCALIAGQVMLEGGGDLGTLLDSYARDGDRCLDRIAGEYAFVIWDERQRRLVCARDGLGIRVAYVARGADVVIVTNVIEAALAHRAISRDLDDRTFLAFLASGTASASLRTPYRSVRLLPEGHTLIVTADGTASLRRHWQFPHAAPPARASESDIVDGYRARLREAVDDRVGGGRATVFLSGGIDSTTIAAAATGRARLRAVTVTYARTPEQADPHLARRAAERLSIPIDVIPGDRFEALDDDGGGPAAVPVDEPTLADWRSLVRHAAANSTVAIHGEDGDALFAPPGGRELLRAHSCGAALVASTRQLVRTRTIPYLGVRLRERLRWTTPHVPRTPAWLSLDARRLLDEPDPPEILGRAPQPLAPHPVRSEMQNRLVRGVPGAFAFALSSGVTRQNLEIRLPLMDSRVLAYVSSIPPIPWCQRKYLARSAFRDDLPVEVLRRPKTPVRGFYEALVATWRRTRLPTMRFDAQQSSIAALIDDRKWGETLRSGHPMDVVVAWRVLLLDRWLKSCTR